MSETDDLRAELTKRGVKWMPCAWEPQTETFYKNGDGVAFIATESTAQDGFLLRTDMAVTTEQAIAATLGTRTLTAERVMAIAGRHQPDYCSDTHVCFDWQAIADELNATLGDVPRLPHFWTHDGALHVEATRMPTRIVVCEGGTCEFVPKRELDASESENAKLRELVKALLTCATDGDCDECRLNGATTWHVGKAQLCDGVWDRVRELGVEVDE